MILGIYGASGLGREILELARIVNEREQKWDDFIFIDDGTVPAFVGGCETYTYNTAKEKFGSELEITMGIGEPTTRGKLFSSIKSDGIPMPTLIHPNVHIPASATIGQGVIIQDGCFISVNVTIEDYVFMQPRCSVGHDCVLHEGCIISTYDSIGGAVSIGRYAFLGMSVAVKQLVVIGDYSIVGMGSMVFKDVEDEMIVMGNPARAIKRNEEHRVFGH